ncbi:NAD(P)-dependent oxidoreductase [Kitasatospora sp. CM 4170]|uniref:NAD-dependent epimerase/dehydratase family protein n=1 Tax=Kitasatospora aburaviensis TaxID=67265 RepID=A0ABW1F9V9_9ACTN|nr:NAD(P)-dependent oxidoreductase [Kitasatospora sp. CM 4170]WNM44552.1 NAD(P)-dependent oxidoreductase [Kitasatospora sp. CM 4170]
MIVLLAGATGAIGRPLTRLLLAAGHEVLGLARSAEAERVVAGLGARPVRADAMDRDGLLAAVHGLRADAVVHQLTALKKPRRTVDETEPSTRLRIEGTANLLAAARVLGAHRFVTQSLVFGYGYTDHGARMLTEADPFGVRLGNLGDVVVDGLRSTEEQTFAAEGLDGIALRFGVFYGPGTWFDPAPATRPMPMPVPRSGGRPTAWVHVADAADATVAALERGRGSEAYNVVDGRPSTWGEVAAATAAARDRRPLRVPGRLLRLAVPYLGTMMLDTGMRVSGAKAERELGWTPAHADHREGLRATVA